MRNNEQEYIYLDRLLSPFTFGSFSLLPYYGNIRTSIIQLIFKESTIFFVNIIKHSS